MPTLYSDQELISKAITLQLRDEGYSCLKFVYQFCYYAQLRAYELKNEYADYTNAHHDGGFHHLLEAGIWETMSFEEKQSYRLEMLYYFWLANQEM